MPRDELVTAAELLDEANDQADGELAERLQGQSDSIKTLATRERGPDQGRLDRHMHTLGELEEETDGELAEKIDRALAELRSYRETVGGI